MKRLDGHGWKMLMDCLAGRGISLPATASKFKSSHLWYISLYTCTEQFRMSLSQMEAIQEKFLRMMFHTWCIQSSVCMTNDILDEGKSPAVLAQS